MCAQRVRLSGDKPGKPRGTRPEGATQETPKNRSKKAPSPYVDNSAAMTDQYFQGMVDSYTTQLGTKDVFTADKAEGCISVIPFPSLCLEYLFAQNGYPLSRIMHLFGAQHSCKSAMACEIMRWHLQQNGFCAISETEGKDIPDLRASIIGNNEFLKRVFFSQDPGTDLWQKRVTHLMAAYKAHADGNGRGKKNTGAGRNTAFNITVDSLGAASMTEERDKIADAGFAGRGFAVSALSIAGFMRALPDQLIDYPISVTLINHQKATTDAMGRPDFSTYGGRSVRFHSTYELEMARKKFFRLAKSGGVEIAFRMRKNGLGECDRRLNARLVWLNKRDAEDNLRQYSYWDWHGATIELLLSLKESSASMRDEINEVVDLQQASNRRVTSRALGISKDSPLRYDEAGDLLHQNKELVLEMRKVLGVHTRPTFEPGIDLMVQKANFEEYRKNYRTCPVLRMDEDAGELAAQLDNAKHAVKEEDD